MRRILAFVSLFVLCTLAFAQTSVQQPQQPLQTGQRGAGPVYVKGYYTKSGKFVQAHYRKHPSTRRQHYFGKHVKNVFAPHSERKHLSSHRKRKGG